MSSDFFQDVATRATEATGHRITLQKSAGYNELLQAGCFRLANGLTVVLMPDKRAPVFTYQTWFKVGSRDEEPTRTGLAHLFEHLMFKGTETHPTGVFDAEMEKRGGQSNAATWVDWTYYTDSLAMQGDNLETVIGFETDRMNRLLLDEDTFRSELEVVKNERRLVVDDSIQGTLSERVFALAYSDHPYRWPTIGYMDHLQATTIADLKKFYRAFYAPNNAVVVLVGDIDATSALTSIANAYGGIPAQDTTRPNRPAEPRQNESRWEQIERPVASPQVLIGYHSPAQMDLDFSALEMLTDALSIGDSARLYRRLVIRDEIATEVDCFVSPFADPGLFEIYISARPGVDPKTIVDVVQDELEKIAEGLSSREVEKAKNDLEISIIAGLKDSEQCAEALGHFQTSYNDFSLAFTAGERLEQVDSERLQRVARDVFRIDNRNVVVAQE